MFLFLRTSFLTVYDEYIRQQSTCSFHLNPFKINTLGIFMLKPYMVNIHERGNGVRGKFSKHARNFRNLRFSVNDNHEKIFPTGENCLNYM